MYVNYSVDKSYEKCIRECKRFLISFTSRWLAKNQLTFNNIDTINIRQHEFHGDKNYDDIRT